jgi:hypothetical protein
VTLRVTVPSPLGQKFATRLVVSDLPAGKKEWFAEVAGTSDAPMTVELLFPTPTPRLAPMPTAADVLLSAAPGPAAPAVEEQQTLVICDRSQAGDPRELQIKPSEWDYYGGFGSS